MMLDPQISKHEVNHVINNSINVGELLLSKETLDSSPDKGKKEMIQKDISLG